VLYRFTRWCLHTGEYGSGIGCCGHTVNVFDWLGQLAYVTGCNEACQAHRLSLLGYVSSLSSTSNVDIDVKNTHLVARGLHLLFIYLLYGLYTR